MAAPMAVPNPGAAPTITAQTLQAVDVAVTLAQGADREDLAARLSQARHRLTDGETKVLVIGEFKQGKSSLVNALISAAVCPVDDDIATAVPTVIRYGDQATAIAISVPTGVEIDQDIPDSQLRRDVIDINRMAEFVTERANPDNEKRVRMVEVTLPRQVLGGGLAIVDTPGVGGLDTLHAAITLRTLPLADAVMFVTDASAEFSQPELDFLKTARELCPNLLCVVTKTDFYPEWRRIVDLDVQHLNRRGLRAPIVSVSSVLREQALRTESVPLNEESGYPPLVNWLRQEVVARAEVYAARTAANDLLAVVGQLEAPLRTERQLLVNPEQAQALVAELERAKARADVLKSQASKWQQTLGDGIADVNSECDHDLRARLREVLREADETLEKNDPAKIWEEFEPWLEKRCAAEVVANYTAMHQQAMEIVERVSEHFAGDEQDIQVQLGIADPTRVVQTLQGSMHLDMEKVGLAGSGLTALRGGYGGFLMISVFGRELIKGLTFFNPLSLGMGLLLGRKSVKEERERHLMMRRNQARQAMRRYVDDLQFLMAKDSRDTLRQIQRNMRDAFNNRADELTRSINESLNVAQGALRQDQTSRDERIRELDGRLNQLNALRQRATQLAPDLAAAPR
jgi:predicted GTPase